MKLTKEQQLDFQEGIFSLEGYDGEVDIKLQYAAAKNAATLKKALEPYEKVKQDLLKTHAEFNDKGEVELEVSGGKMKYKFKTPKDEKLFVDKIKKLMAEEEEIDIHQVKISDLSCNYKQNKIKNFMLVWDLMITE